MVLWRTNKERNGRTMARTRQFSKSVIYEPWLKQTALRTTLFYPLARTNPGGMKVEHRVPPVCHFYCPWRTIKGIRKEVEREVTGLGPFLRDLEYPTNRATAYGSCLNMEQDNSGSRRENSRMEEGMTRKLHARTSLAFLRLENRTSSTATFHSQALLRVFVWLRALRELPRRNCSKVLEFLTRDTRVVSKNSNRPAI